VKRDKIVQTQIRCGNFEFNLESKKIVRREKSAANPPPPPNGNEKPMEREERMEDHLHDGHRVEWESPLDEDELSSLLLIRWRDNLFLFDESVRFNNEGH